MLLLDCSVLVVDVSAVAAVLFFELRWLHLCCLSSCRQVPAGSWVGNSQAVPHVCVLILHRGE